MLIMCHRSGRWQLHVGLNFLILKMIGWEEGSVFQGSFEYPLCRSVTLKQSSLAGFLSGKHKFLPWPEKCYCYSKPNSEQIYNICTVFPRFKKNWFEWEKCFSKNHGKNSMIQADTACLRQLSPGISEAKSSFSKEYLEFCSIPKS